MKVNSSNVNIYLPDIHKHIFRYAYENAEIGKLLTDVKVEWFGEIFNTADIDSIFHRDILFYLKKEKLYSKIKSQSNKFIILPDVFSERSMPNSFFKLDEVDENGIKDYGNRNIVIINGKVFELIDRELGGIKFCYSGKLYYFYNTSHPLSIHLESQNPSLRVISTYRYSEFDYNKKYPIGHKVDGSFLLYLDINNNILTEPSGEYLTVEVKYPSIEYDYNSDEIINKSTIVGLFSVNPLDVFVQEKIYDEREDRFIIHNRNYNFTQTMLVIYKDGTYKILNEFNDHDKFNRLDKHTIIFNKDDTVSKVIAFFKPIFFEKDVARVDSLYDDVMSISEYGFYDLKYYQKNTDYLYNWILNKNPSVEELVEYGYKYDLDVLYAIQKAFPLVKKIPTSAVYVAKTDNHIRASKQNQLFITVPNILGLQPILFIDGILFSHDIRVTNISPDQNSIHLNISKWNSDLNDILKNDPMPETKIREFFKNKELVIAYMSFVKTGASAVTYTKEYKPVLYKDLPMTLISKSEFIDNRQSLFFANGRLCIFDKMNSPYIYAQYLYDVGMGVDCKVITMLNKIESLHHSITKLNIDTPYNINKYTIENKGIYKHENFYSEDCMLNFNLSGKLVNDEFNVLDVNHMVTKSNFKTIKNMEPMSKSIRLLRVNNLYDIDLEIDYSKVDLNFNIGSFNEKVVERNPSILRYFMVDSNFIEENLVKCMPESEAKLLGDIVSTFGACGNTPFNRLDYSEFLERNDIQVVNHGDFIPNYSMFPKHLNKYVRVYNLAAKVFSNYLSANNLATTSVHGKLFTSDMVDFNTLDPQIKYHIKKEFLLGSEVKLILLDVDTQFNYTDDFNNPGNNDPTIDLTTQTLEMNYAYDQANSITTITLPTETLSLDIDGGENK